MPNTLAEGTDPVGWWRKAFLDAVALHVPGVLDELRNEVLPLRRALAYYADHDPTGVRNAEAELSNALATWRERHHLTVVDPAEDWIGERTAQTLDDWCRRGRFSPPLLRSDEVSRLGGGWLLRLKWSAPEGLGEEPVIDVAGAIAELEKAVASGADTEADQAYQRLGELLRERREREASRETKEVAHFRWLALWQCGGLSYRDVATHEAARSGEALKWLGAVLSRQASGSALKVILDRGEPYVPFWSDGLWGQIFGASDSEIDALVQRLRAQNTRPIPKGTVQAGVVRAAEGIGLQRRS